VLDPADLASPARVEQIRRSVAMCNTDVPRFTNADVDRLLRALIDTLDELRRLRRWCGLEQ
jgi:hypothetical protein